MKSIFLIENKGLGRLNPEEATRLFQQLLWAESRRLGIPNSKVHISLRTDIADGGIDASIEETNDDFKGDLIKKGLTSYQIKASETLNIHRKSSVKQELFSNKKITKANLGSGVINCLENGGTYILANFGADPTDQQRRDAVTYFKEYFSLCGYLDPSVEIWGQSELAGFINIFPSLTLQIQGLIDERFNTHGEWANQAEMSREYVPGDDQIKIIDSIRHELGSDHGTIHIRIWGEPGIGKTRIALEATRHDAFSPLVLYTKAVNFVDSDLWYFLSRSVNNVAILVVDECDFNNAVSIWNNFKYSGPRIKILTITNEYETSTGNTQYFYIPRLEDDKVIEIINSYGIQKEDARHLSQFCDGSPRVAHILSANFLTNPGDLLRSSDTVNVWDRYIGGMDDLGSPIVQERRLVLEYLALFKKFGFGRPLKEEAAVIQRKINLQNPAITWLKFVEIIKGLKERKILQGEITLYITPKALHIKLWKDWWETYGEHFEFDEFADDLPPPLLDWFLDMFKYAAESDAAKNVIADLFGKNGSFQNKDVIQERLGARFFLSIAEGAPEQALDFLKTYIGRKGVEELRNFTTGRREVIWALEKIVIWKDLFPDAARLLLALGEAENETVSNNASGLFAELFTPGWGKLAQTEASPQDRYPILVEALESESKGKRFLGLEAANRGLQTSHYTRWIGPEHQGIKPSPKLWTPEKWGEIFDAFRQVWELLTIKLPDFDMDEKNKAIAIMLQNARALLNINSLVEMVLETLEVLRREPYSREKEVLKVIIQTIHYDGEKLGRESLNRLITYRNEIEGTDYSSRLKRFIGMNLMEDRFDAEGNQKKEYNLRIKELAELSYKNVDQFLKEVEWLVADSPDNAYNFGYEVGIIDTENILYDELIVIQRRLKKRIIFFWLVDICAG